MAAASPSPPPPQERTHPPSQPPPPPAPPSAVVATAAPSSTSRRLPPPCWSPDETVALIDSYREKWYSLRRGNLKATHWQEVADAVAARCPLASPAKTSVQCRHKMEKLRKRYRTELQRSLSAPSRNRSSSGPSWIHFHRMHSMEKGPAAVAVAVAQVAAAADSASDGLDGDDDDDNNGNDEDDEDGEDLYGNVPKNGSFSYNRSLNSLMNNGVAGGSSSGRNAFRIKFPGGPSGMGVPPGFRPKSHENPNPNFGSRVMRDFGEPRGPAVGKRREREGSAVVEMVEAVKLLGDGFVRMEKMKMEMAREIEAMRMEMEMKRTEMILESQQRIVEAFAKGFAEKKKKAKRVPSPES